MDVVGSVSPCYTTDVMATILAEYINAEILRDVTSIDSAYEADPHVYTDAKKI